MPFAALCTLLFCTVLAGAPFSSARAALLPDVLPGDAFMLGSAVGNICFQASQILGLSQARRWSPWLTIPDAGFGCRYVRRLGSYHRRMGQGAAVAPARGGGPALLVGGVSRRDPDRLR
jgi:hypothetical protein